MEVNIIEIKDGDKKQSTEQAPSILDAPKLESNAKKKRRRGKSKRKIMKPFVKTPWQDRRKIIDKTKRNNRFRKLVLNKTHAPFNNNQFLMEIHKPEPENNFSRTPARTRDSSFSIDSEDNYFFSLPEDEEEYLTKEFSSVYEDAQCERLSNMSKNELIQEYLLLEAKYENLMKRTERTKPRSTEDDKDTVTEKDTSVTEDRDSMVTNKDTSVISNDSSITDDENMDAIMRHVKEQESQIRELQLANDQLRMENEALRQRTHDSSSEDSESDSSTTSGSSSSSSCNMSPAPETEVEMEESLPNGTHNGQNDTVEQADNMQSLVNGFSEE